MCGTSGFARRTAEGGCPHMKLTQAGGCPHVKLAQPGGCPYMKLAQAGGCPYMKAAGGRLLQARRFATAARRPL